MVYSGVRYVVGTFLSKFGVEVTWVDGSDVKQYKDAVKANTKVRTTCRFLDVSTILTGKLNYFYVRGDFIKCSICASGYFWGCVLRGFSN